MGLFPCHGLCVKDTRQGNGINASRPYRPTSVFLHLATAWPLKNARGSTAVKFWYIKFLDKVRFGGNRNEYFMFCYAKYYKTTL